MPENPRVTAADLRSLLASRTADPVLYVDVESGLRLDVWTSALVSHHHAVISRDELADAVGEDVTNDVLADLLPELQDTVDRIAANER